MLQNELWCPCEACHFSWDNASPDRIIITSLTVFPWHFTWKYSQWHIKTCSPLDWNLCSGENIAENVTDIKVKTSQRLHCIKRGPLHETIKDRGFHFTCVLLNTSGNVSASATWAKALRLTYETEMMMNKWSKPSGSRLVNSSKCVRLSRVNSAICRPRI